MDKREATQHLSDIFNTLVPGGWLILQQSLAPQNECKVVWTPEAFTALLGGLKQPFQSVIKSISYPSEEHKARNELYLTWIASTLKGQRQPGKRGI